jgi:replicative DNA helicase
MELVEPQSGSPDAWDEAFAAFHARFAPFFYRREVRERNVSAAARGLKDVSGELGVPVLALVQLNRNRATRVDKRPQLADLRESGDLENTADSVLGLYRDEIDHPESDDRGLAELSVLKKRQLGEEVGTIRRLVWVGESYRDFTHQSRPHDLALARR